MGLNGQRHEGDKLAHGYAEVVMDASGVLNTADEEEPYEEVDHPAHYGGDTPYEPIKVMEAWQDMFQISINVMMAIKYLVRAGAKPGASVEKDIRKALWHINRELANTTQGTRGTAGADGRGRGRRAGRQPLGR